MKPFTEPCNGGRPEFESRRIRIILADCSAMLVDAQICKSQGLKLNERNPFMTAEKLATACLAMGVSHE